MMMGKIWFRIGLITAPLSLIIWLCVLPFGEGVWSTVGTVLCVVQCNLMIVSIFFIERALKRAFDENGNPRT